MEKHGCWCVIETAWRRAVSNTINMLRNKLYSLQLLRPAQNSTVTEMTEDIRVRDATHLIWMILNSSHIRSHIFLACYMYNTLIRLCRPVDQDMSPSWFVAQTPVHRCYTGTRDYTGTRQRQDGAQRCYAAAPTGRQTCDSSFASLTPHHRAIWFLQELSRTCSGTSIFCSSLSPSALHSCICRRVGV